MRAFVFAVCVVIALLAGVGLVSLFTRSSAPSSVAPAAAVIQQAPTQAVAQQPSSYQPPPTQVPVQQAVVQHQEGGLPNAPVSQAAWVQLVEQSVAGSGAVVAGTKIQDGYGAVQVHFDVPWTLPMGWQAHTGDGANLNGGQTVPSGMVSSIYPPCSWREKLQFKGC